MKLFTSSRSGLGLHDITDLMKPSDQALGGFLCVGAVEVCAPRSCHSVPSRNMCQAAVSMEADVASRKVLAHRVAITLEAIHAREAIEQALARHGAPEIVNTDHGSQFTAVEFTDVVLGAGCKLSMDGRVYLKAWTGSTRAKDSAQHLR